MWHHAGKYVFDEWTQPTRHFENPETKRRLHNLLDLSGLTDQMTVVKPRIASEEELLRFHSSDYVEKVKDLSSKYGGEAGDCATFMKGGFEIASLAVGGTIDAVDKVVKGELDNAYVLCRPPGHHATREQGMGFCLFNNVALAAMHALEMCGISRIAIIDYDVHHGNGTQQAFFEDDRVLFISIHQDCNYPLDSGHVTENGSGKGLYHTINIPLPPGSGSGAYHLAMDSVVVPAIDAFSPELILVSSGYDAAFLDPLGCQMLISDDFRQMAHVLISLADSHSGGRIVFVHEGGYSDIYVPFCGLAVCEELTGIQTEVEDNLKLDGQNWGYQEAQPHQTAVVNEAANIMQRLKTVLESSRNLNKENGASSSV